MRRLGLQRVEQLSPQARKIYELKDTIDFLEYELENNQNLDEITEIHLGFSVQMLGEYLRLLKNQKVG